ncbi:unnamed protein product [Rotaria sordida]|uniref:FAM65 N-terminal domain-containing protein n=1 Tax=Rotaria sordida TaxID=392033 RepID=A0A814I6K5_9BILA|nr:unnamed protein product [Rotaria sordida]
MSTNRLTPFNKRTMPTNNNTHTIPDILGHEQIDLTRLKKQAQLTQTQIPKIPRITRTLNTLENVLKVLEEHSRTSKYHIDQLVESVEKENHQLARQLHESQVAYLKLQAHTASLQSLKECYCRYAHMLDGARTMFNAYQQTTTRRDSIDQVKLGLKECTKTLCAIEAQLEAMLGTFVLNLQEISGFSRICPGDEYELIIRYGQQKWKTRGRIPKHDKNEQNWTRQIFHLKAKLADLLLIKISEVRLLGVSLKTIGTKCFEVNNFYSMETQRMIINANQSGTIKLIFLVNWEFDLIEKFYTKKKDTDFHHLALSQCDQSIIEFWSKCCSNETFIVSFERCLNEIMKYLNCNQDIAEYLLNNLCYLSFRINFVHPKFLTLIQIWFLLKKDQSDIDKDIQIANEQIELSKNLSNLILNNNYTQIALMLNRRTLNNNEFINRILYEYDFKIPDELIGMLLTSIRYDVISHLRTTLLSHNDNPYFIMGKQNRAIAQKAKVKQQQNNKKPKPVKTNLKRLNERVRNKVEQVDKLYDNKSNEKKQKMETTKQDTSSVDNK